MESYGRFAIFVVAVEEGFADIHSDEVENDNTG